jgi:hypothetical protein
MSSFGPPELHRIGGCHARSSLRASRTFRDAARTSCLVCRRRYSHIEGRRLLPGDAAARSHKGTAIARPLDRWAAAADLGTAASTPVRGTATTTRQGRGAEATAATGRGSTVARYRATAVVASAVANESGLGVKNWTLALRIFLL